MSTWITKRAKRLGLPVIDAPESVQLVVSAEDIRSSKEKEPGHCAFAQCAKRHGAKAAYFFRSMAYVETEDAIVRYWLPKSARKAVAAFDRGKGMKPGPVLLRKPPPSDSMEGNAKRNRKRPTRHQRTGERNGDRKVRKVRKVAKDIRQFKAPTNG